MPTELKEIDDLLFEVLEECSDDNQLKFDIHQKFNRRLDFNFNKKPIYSEQEVQELKDKTEKLEEQAKIEKKELLKEIRTREKAINILNNI